MISKTLFIRILSFGALTTAWYFSLLLIAVPLSLWHLVQFKAYEFIALGILIDLYFMPIRLIPVYTICFVGAFVIMEIIKPRFRNSTSTV